MATVMVTGRLFRQPERKTSAAGKVFTTAKIKEGSGDNVAWWSAVAFGDTAEALAAMQDGEAVSLSGNLAVETYKANDGETRVSLKVVAEAILSARKRRKPKPQSANSPDNTPQNDRNDFIDDAMPF